MRISDWSSDVGSSDLLDYVLEDLDLVLLMSVNPGFGGQGFIPSTLRKIERVRERIEASGKSIRLEVDGGVKPDNIADIARAGADTFVAGSAIFGTVDSVQVVAQMRAAVDSVTCAPAPRARQLGSAPSHTPTECASLAP